MSASRMTPRRHRAVASAASRLANHAYCDAHDEPDPRNCPYCADRAAYVELMAAFGLTVAPEPPSKSIPLWDIPITEVT